MAFLDNERDAGARKAYLLAYNNRQATANTDLLEQAIAVRDHLAHLLGYQTWAAYQLSDRMAKTPSRVLDFLERSMRSCCPKRATTSRGSPRSKRPTRAMRTPYSSRGTLRIMTIAFAKRSMPLMKMKCANIFPCSTPLKRC